MSLPPTPGCFQSTEVSEESKLKYLLVEAENL